MNQCLKRDGSDRIGDIVVTRFRRYRNRFARPLQLQSFWNLKFCESNLMDLKETELSAVRLLFERHSYRFEAVNGFLFCS